MVKTEEQIEQEQTHEISMEDIKQKYKLQVLDVQNSQRITEHEEKMMRLNAMLGIVEKQQKNLEVDV